MASRSFAEKIRQRRQAMQNTTNEDSSPEPTPRRKPRKRDKWDEEQSIEMTQMDGHDSSTELLDEVKSAETLMDDLSRRRKAKQRELSKTLRTDTSDASRELRKAKKKSKEKISQSVRQEGGADEEEELLEDEDEDKIEEIQPEPDEEAEVIEMKKDEPPKPTPRRTKGLMSVEDAVLAASSGGVGVGKSPRSMNASIRERLRSKVQTAREKAETEVKEETRPSRRLKDLRNIPMAATRFDDPSLMTKDDYEAELALEKKRSTREKWKKAAEEIHEKTRMPTAREAFDFFTQVHYGAEETPEIRPLPSEPTPGPSGEGEEITEEGKEEETTPKEVEKPEEEKLLADDEEDTGRPIVIGRAEYPQLHEILKKEEEMYFVPSIVSKPASEKVFEQAEPRFLEDEGFYVGTRPVVTLRNQNVMEDRLLHETNKGQDWFGEDGRMIALPDPHKEIPSRPNVPEEIDPQLQTEYRKAITKEFDSRFIDGSIESKGRYQLDVDINSLVFKHHHMFNREHVLSTRLVELYNQYCNSSKKNVVEYLSEKLRALKGASAHLQENIVNIKSQRKMNEEHVGELESRLQDYKYEIKQTRHLRDIEEQADRTLLRAIIRTWKEIKNLRQMQQYTSTSVKLQIRKEDTDRAQDELLWKQEIEEEIQELKNDCEYDFDKKMEEYNKKLNEWKQSQKARKEAAKRKKLRRKRAAREQPEDQEEPEEDDLEQANKDDEILEQEPLSKPKKPEKFNETEAREKVKAKAMQNRRRPGEPILHPEVTQTATITPANQCPRAEQQRRDFVSKFKVFVKVLFNDKEVSRTNTKLLGQEFKINFAAIFNIQIVQWPQNIRIQLFESSGLTSNLLAELYVGIPEATVTSDNVQLEDMEFSSDHTVNHPHEGVGSGVPFSFEADGGNIQCLMTTGVLSASVSWGMDNHGIPLVPPSNSNINSIFNAMKGLDAVASIGAAAMTDMDKLTKWITESRLDPNDPSNADLVYMMKPRLGDDGQSTAFRLPDYFRLEQLQEEFNLATDHEITSSKRFKLIQFREKEISEFRNWKLIPPLEKEIPPDVFAAFEKKEKEKEKLRMQEDIESHRAAVAAFMQKVREQVMQRFHLAAHQKQFHHVIFEEEVPNIGTLIPSLLKLGEPRRPLRPIRKERKKVSAQNLQDREVFILVNIVRAFDVPVRVEATSGHQTDRSAPRGQQQQQRGQRTIKNIAGEVLVRPFIEVMFQHERKQTSVADGPNPSWNEELNIRFRAPNNDYTASNLQTVNDIVYLNLFDEVVTDVLEDDRMRGKSVHQRIEKKWLGSIRIPFSTIYFNTMIEGTFEVDAPPILLGYTHDARSTRIDPGGGGGGFEVGMGAANKTYLTLFLTMEPQLNVPDAVKEKFDSNEDEKLLVAAENWQNTLEGKFPKREFTTTVIDVNGKSVFITRYFKALKPPDEILNQNTSPEAQADLVARYVSMIPFVSDSVVFPGLCDIWSTSDQFLQMLAGDEEEHAVLLTNYFMHLGKKVWLLLGTAIPEGSTAYVLTQEGNTYWIWNASTGDHYDCKDNYCPLQSVGCLVNNENVWANTQPNDHPARISFDLTNTSNWRPFFSKSFPNPDLSSIQPEQLIYFPTDKNYTLDLQDKIERTLRQKFMETWRPRAITRWNRYCQQSFRTLLSKIEENLGKGQSGEHMQELEQVLGSYKLSGFPINLPYTEMQPLIEAVYSTGVWDNDNADVEFALAVHIHPYPNSVLSVWIYVASLIKKR